MSSNSSAKAVRTISLMAIIIFCAKFMGLLREVIVAGIYGQGYAADILNSATQIPLLFFDMTLGVAILSTFVPIFNKYLEQDGKQKAMDFANNFMTITVTLAAILAIVGTVFSQQIVRIMAPGYSAEKVYDTARLLRILFPSLIFTAAAYTSVGILQSFGEFNIPSIISLVSNLVMILYLLIWGSTLGLVGITLSMVIAWALQLFIQLPHLFQFGFKFRPRLFPFDPGIKSAARLAVPVLISSWVQPLCSVINMAFGSSLGDGAVSGLGWANKIYIIMVGVFAYAFTNFIFPKLSRMEAGNNAKGFQETTQASVSFIVLIITYVCAMFVALSKPIIQLVFERGQFDHQSTLLTANALFYYSFGMVGYAICEILNKSFYAIQDGKTPMATSLAGILVNFFCAFLFVKLLDMKTGGLALASAVSSLVMAALLIGMMNRRKPHTFDKKFFVNLGKVIFCGILSGLTAVFILLKIQGFGTGLIFTLLKLFACAVPALIVYIIFAFTFRVIEVKHLRRRGHEE